MRLNAVEDANNFDLDPNMEVSVNGANPASGSSNNSVSSRDNMMESLAAEDTAKKPYVCPTCGKAFGRISHMRRHQLLHTGEKPFGCEICHERFTRQENRDRHMVIHTKVRPYSCSVCQKGFTQLNRMKVHMMIHSGDRPFVCQTCGKGFMRLDHLKVHVKTHGIYPERGHGPIWNRKQDSFPEEYESVNSQQLPALKEEVSGQSWNRDVQPTPIEPTPVQSREQVPQVVDRRSDVHEKPFQCPHCPKTFSRRDHFSRHILVHSGAKPHECDVCSRCFSRKDNKYSHMVNCILKNYGIIIDQEESRGTLEMIIELKMAEIRSTRQRDNAMHFMSEEQPTESPDDGLDAVIEPMIPLNVGTSPSPDADNQSLPSPASVGTLRLRALNELSDNGLQYGDLNQAPAEDPAMQQQHYDQEYQEDDDDDDEDYVDPSTFLSAHLTDAPEDYADLNPDEAPSSFQCEVCQRQFVHKSHLVRHSMVHTGTKPYRCDQCDRGFNRKEHLQRHVIVHTGIKPFKCSFCAKSFYHLHQQARHINEEHAYEAATAGTPSDMAATFMDSGKISAFLIVFIMKM